MDLIVIFLVMIIGGIIAALYGIFADNPRGFRIIVYIIAFFMVSIGSLFMFAIISLIRNPPYG